MSDTDTPVAPPWVVTGQIAANGPQPGGNYGPGYNVSFRLASGTVGTVFVPASQYSVENVRAAINAHYPSLAAVDGLSG